MTVGPGGLLLKDGEPFRAFGVNYYDAFYRVLKNHSDTSYRGGFAQLKARGITVARFSCGGFWPSEWGLYFNNKALYFAKLDGVVQAAEDAGIGLIPSLFWTYFTLPDLAHEPCNRWGDPNSATIALMKQYTRDVVERYKDSPAIYAWEFGNEYNGQADLPNAEQWRPPVMVSLGTPKTRSHEDDLRSHMLLIAFTQFAETVRSIDATRPITTGNSLPRGCAEHLRASLSWTLDSPEEFKQNLLDMTPAPMNLISIHCYPLTEDVRFDGTVAPFSTILTLCEQASSSSGKAIFLGEFGAPSTLGVPETPTRLAFESVVSDVAQSSLPVALAWVYDFAGQAIDWNITPANHRKYMLDALVQGNTLMRQSIAIDSRTAPIVEIDTSVELEAPSGSNYRWYRNGTPLPDQTNGTLSLEAAQMSDTGSYSCVYTNSHGYTLTTLSYFLTVTAAVPAAGLAGLGIAAAALLLSALAAVRNRMNGA